MIAKMLQVKICKSNHDAYLDFLLLRFSFSAFYFFFDNDNKDNK